MTKVKMALALDKLIKDVKEEKILWNENRQASHTTEEEESAWNRVASKNMLTGGEAKSIFKVLCKKYYQEAQKSQSSWQLFESLKFLDEKNEETSAKAEINNQTATSPSSNHEEETFVELLEVKDEEFSDDETATVTPVKDVKDIKEDVKPNVTILNNEISSRNILKSANEKCQQKEHSNSNHQNNTNSVTADRKNHQISHNSSLTIKKEKDGTIINTLKRKYSSLDNNHHHSNNSDGNQKSSSTDSPIDTSQHEFQEKRRLLKLSSSTSMNSQQQKSHNQHQKHNQQTNNDVTVAVPKDIVEAVSILNNGKNKTTSTQMIAATNNIETTNENDENLKYGSFGNYVAQTMNRLTPKLAAKLEIKILQSIIEITSEMMNHF